MKKIILLLLLSSIFSNHTSYNSDQTNKRFKNTIHETMWSVYRQKKDPKKSFETLLKIANQNKYAYKWLINLLHKTENFCKITQMIPIIKKTYPDLLQNDPDIGFMVAHSLMRCKAMISNQLAIKREPLQIAFDQEAMDIIKPINQKFPSDQQAAALTAALYDLSDDPLNALAVSEKYLNSTATKPTDFALHFKNAARYLKLGKKEQALKSTKKCLDVQPGFVPAWILSGNINNELNDTENAINDFKTALEIAGPNKMIELTLIKLFFKLKKAQHKLSEFVMNKQCMEKAITLLREKKYTEALNLIDQCLAEKPKSDTKDGTGTLTVKVI